MKCPYCAEEIKDEAKKCRYCGEWLEIRTESTSNKQVGYDKQHEVKDNSNIKYFEASMIANDIRPESNDKHVSAWEDSNTKKVKRIHAFNESDARMKFIKENVDFSIDEKQGIKEIHFYEGKFSCPNCNAKHTKCEKKLGCAIWIIILVSIGIGLIMIPFLPYHCECMVCGHKWKT